MAEGDINYNGSVNISQGGFPCLYWNDSTYHKDFPMQHNYCRALAEEDGGIPWCYLNQEKSGRYWDYCNIPICGNSTKNDLSIDNVYLLVMKTERKHNIQFDHFLSLSV